MRNISRKIISILMCLMVLFGTVSTVAVASYEADYPPGVTAQEATNAVSGTDTLLNNAVPALTGKKLPALVKPMLYSSETLSSLLLGIYKDMSADAQMMEALGVDISLESVADALYSYPDVYQALLKADTWAEVDLAGINWGVKDKQTFATALGKAMSPFNDLFYMLLCSGEYKLMDFITINGANGYENAIVPLLHSLKCENLISQEEFTLQATQDKSTMVKNIALPVLSFLEKALENPANELTSALPSFAYFKESGELQACMDSLMSPIMENSLVKLAGLLKIIDTSALTLDLNMLLQGGIGGFSLAPIDTARLSKCGSHNGFEFVSDKGRAYVEIMRWLVDSLKLNKDSLLNGMSGEGAAAISPDIIKGLIDKDTDLIVGAVIKLFTPGALGEAELMVYPDLKETSVAFTPNLKDKELDKVLKEIDPLLNDFVKEGGSYSTVESLLKSTLFTNANINAALTGIYGTLEKEGLSSVLLLMGIDISPKGVAKHLTSSDYEGAVKVLNGADSWNNVSLKGVTWGFYNGSQNGFRNALTAILRPLYPVLRTVLAGEDMVVFDAITVKGADGYNTAIIPLLEALGCTNIKTYSEYLNSSSGDGVITSVIDPVFSLFDELSRAPVNTLTKKLPNIVYFINSGSLEKCITNLLLPITSFTDSLSGIVDMKVDVSALTKDLDLNKLLTTVLEGTGMKVAQFDINQVAGMGKRVERTSKRSLNGEYVKYYYVEAEQKTVLMAVLRVLAKTLKTPGNENLLMGTMAGDNSTFATYSSSISEQFAAMTEDELIEWLYNLLFKERAQVEIVVDEDYKPTIIFKEPEPDYTWVYIAGGVLGVGLLAGIILYVNRKRLFS